MPGRIFISYRRDDAADAAARVAERLAARFGRGSVLMDVNILRPGQRFDRRLEEALAVCDVLIAVIGARWMELLKARERLKAETDEPDYVLEEIGAALRRGIVVIPVRVGRDGQMPTLPRRSELPEDIRDLVLHEKHDVAHERFDRDLAELADAIVEVRRAPQPLRGPMRWHWSAAGIGIIGSAAMLALYLWPAPTATRVAVAPSHRSVVLPAGRAPAPLTVEEEHALGRDNIHKGMRFRECAVCPEMVVVPSGSFTMGSPPEEEGRSESEGPQVRVTFARPFAVGRFEVTFAEWDACVTERGCSHRPSDDWGRGRQPVMRISWDDITRQYLPWLSRRTGKTYRLLTEAEWEYVARAGTTTPFWWGASITTSQANYYGEATYGGGPTGEYRGKTVPVNSFAPNPWGLYNVHGNVWEWVQDCWNDNHSAASPDGFVRADGDCSHRVLRGGSWYGYPRVLRAAYRISLASAFRYDFWGFRVARSL
jgi:formylglycine-generating enzyme required for sulfatase activity